MCKHKAVSMCSGEEREVPPVWPGVGPGPSLTSGWRNLNVRLGLSGQWPVHGDSRPAAPSAVSSSMGPHKMGFSKPHWMGPSPLRTRQALIIE